MAIALASTGRVQVGLIQTWSGSQFQYILPWETSEPLKSVLQWISIMGVSYPSGVLIWEKFVFHSSIKLFRVGQEPAFPVLFKGPVGRDLSKYSSGERLSLKLHQGNGAAFHTVLSPAVWALVWLELLVFQCSMADYFITFTHKVSFCSL